MSKPAAHRIHCDDCAVIIDGQTYYPHEGEWIDVMGVLTLDEIRAFRRFNEMRPQLDALEGEPDALQRSLELLDDVMAPMVETMAQRIVAWNWTDMQGRPLDLPYQNPRVLGALSVPELAYLAGAFATGEGAREKKDATKATPITSLATERRRSRSS